VDRALLERRRRGRPSLVEGQSSTPVNVRLSEGDYRAATSKAHVERTTVTDLMRRALKQYLVRPPTSD